MPRIVGHEQVECLGRIGDPAGGIQARSDQERHGLRGQLSHIGSPERAQRRYSGERVAAHAHDPVGDERAVLVHQRHDVGDRAEGGQTGQVRARRPARPASGPTAATSLRATPAPARASNTSSRTSLELRIAHRDAGRHLVARLVVVGHDDTHSRRDAECRSPRPRRCRNPPSRRAPASGRARDPRPQESGRSPRSKRWGTTARRRRRMLEGPAPQQPQPSTRRRRSHRRPRYARRHAPRRPPHRRTQACRGASRDRASRARASGSGSAGPHRESRDRAREGSARWCARRPPRRRVRRRPPRRRVSGGRPRMAGSRQARAHASREGPARLTACRARRSREKSACYLAPSNRFLSAWKRGSRSFHNA